jgi:hypothetical protein
MRVRHLLIQLISTGACSPAVLRAAMMGEGAGVQCFHTKHAGWVGVDGWRKHSGSGSGSNYADWRTSVMVAEFTGAEVECTGVAHWCSVLLRCTTVVAVE